MRLKPFAFSNTSTESINFSLPNSRNGINVKIDISTVESCLSIKVCPIQMTRKTGKNQEFYEFWQVMRQYTKEYCLPVYSYNPLLKEVNDPFSHVQFGKGYIQLFWNKHVLKITCDEKNKDLVLRFKRMYALSVLNSNEIKTVEIDEQEYILNITKSPTKDEYIEILKHKDKTDLMEKSKIQRVERIKQEKKIRRRDSINRFLKYIGLQLKN